jgi:chromosome segregation ATPase
MQTNYQKYLGGLETANNRIAEAKYANSLLPYFSEIQHTILENRTLLSQFEGIVSELVEFTSCEMSDLKLNDVENLSKVLPQHFLKLSDIQKQIAELNKTNFANTEIHNTVSNLKSYCYNRMALNEIGQALNLLLVSKEANAQQNLQAEIETLKLNLQNLDGTFRQTESDKNSFANSIQGLQSENKQLKSKISTLNKGLEELSNQKSDASSEFYKLKEENEILNIRVNNQNENIEKLNANVAVLTTEIKNLENTNGGSSKNVKILKYASAFFSVLSIILFFMYNSLNSDLKSIRSELYEKENQLSNLEQTYKTKLEEYLSELNFLKTKINKISSNYPISITEIKVERQNIGDSDYSSNGTFYSSDITYIRPKITYNSNLANSSSLTLYCKIIDPYGDLQYNSSYAGYTLKNEISISGNYYQGNEDALDGWGRTSGGLYVSGTWKIEVWYSGKCLGYTTFYVN